MSINLKKMDNHFSYIPEKNKENIEKQIIEWRRLFHQFPEPAWCEFNTASVIAGILKDLGYELILGKDLLDSSKRLGIPDQSVQDDFFRKALSDANKDLLSKMKGGYTAVAGILENDKGPVVLFRFDMDALPLNECNNQTHFPVKKGFQSKYKNYMHACGHDAHAAIGLGLAFVLKELKDQIKGKIILLFQPAEEGLRGANALINNPLFKNIEYAVGFHLWAHKHLGQIICGTNEQMASSKFDVFINGKAAHAGLNPDDGMNALLPAAEIILELEKIRKNDPCNTKLNVGIIEGGAGRNIICPKVKMCIETRANHSKLNQQIYHECVAIIQEKVNKYGCKYQITPTGYADAADSNVNLAKIIQTTAQNLSYFSDIRLQEKAGGNCEDFTVFMNHIHKNGGYASYIGIGAGKNAGAHHTSNFDIDEKCFIHVLDLLTGICLNTALKK